MPQSTQMKGVTKVTEVHEACDSISTGIRAHSGPEGVRSHPGTSAGTYWFEGTVLLLARAGTAKS